MFTDFLYILRSYGMKTGLNEWNSLMEGLSLDLNQTGLTEFYWMARAILVKKEVDYDRFDQAFLEYFKQVKQFEDLPAHLYDWLSKTYQAGMPDREEADAMWRDMDLSQIEKLMKKRMEEQTEAHNGGSKWIGTGGMTAFGHSGYAPHGIRLSGTGMGQRALKVAGERKFQDFREDKVLQIRQFQMAFRKLRLLSSKEEGAKTEFHVAKTIEETCKQGGRLKIVMERPRKNQTKLLLLIDSGGSMWAYADLCNHLFQAVNQASHFKDLKIYYFHNCIYEHLFTSPACLYQDKISTEWLLKNLNPDYKVIMVGDATMAPAELLQEGGALDYAYTNQIAGIEWLKQIKRHFPALIWLNPLHEKLWNYDYSAYTIRIIKQLIPMFPLTVQGLEQGIKKLRKEEMNG